jgi:hypothetical protein
VCYQSNYSLLFHCVASSFSFSFISAYLFRIGNVNEQNQLKHREALIALDSTVARLALSGLTHHCRRIAVF